MPRIITPLGNRLVDRVLDAQAAADFRDDSHELTGLRLAPFELTDLQLIATGGYSPLTGFLTELDYIAVINTGYLADGRTPWTVPVTLGVDEPVAATLRSGQVVALSGPDDRLVGRLTVSGVFRRRVDVEARGVFGTTDDAHPGVARIRRAGQWLVGGAIDVLPEALPADYHGLEWRPAAIREQIARRGWQTVVAFQTRNPIHRAHEHLIRTALETADGVLIHPLVGETRADDLPADVRVRAYTTLVERYFPPERVILAALPVAMRYAGPKEAIHHALIRRNYGASGFIVGRDHAGVGAYYGTYDAQRIFATYPAGVLGIRNINFEHVAWSRQVGAIVSSKTGPELDGDRVFISGTRLRELLAAGEEPPVEIVRPEIADILIAHYRERDTAATPVGAGA